MFRDHHSSRRSAQSLSLCHHIRHRSKIVFQSLSVFAHTSSRHGFQQDATHRSCRLLNTTLHASATACTHIALALAGIEVLCLEADHSSPSQPQLTSGLLLQSTADLDSQSEDQLSYSLARGIMCGISAIRYTTCGYVNILINESIVRCKYFRQQQNRCNGHLDTIRTVGHEGGRCVKHPQFGEQPSTEDIMQRQRRQEP